MASSALLGPVAVISHLLSLFPPLTLCHSLTFKAQQTPAIGIDKGTARAAMATPTHAEPEHRFNGEARFHRAPTLTRRKKWHRWMPRVYSASLCFAFSVLRTTLLCFPMLCFALLCCALLTLLCTWFVYWLFLFLHFALLRALLVVDICCHSCAAVPAYIKPCPWPAPTQLMAVKEKWQEPR